MTFTNNNNKYPRSITFNKKESNIKLIVHGQGVFIFETQDNTKECSFKVYDKNEVEDLTAKIKYQSLTNC